MSIAANLQEIKNAIPPTVTLVAVTKTKSVAEIMEAYEAGHRNFGENKIQEMTQKYEQLPKDIRWHMIGHLQSNKVKYMAEFVHLIHGVDKWSTLKEIDKQAQKHHRIIDCLLQVFIAEEDTKFGFSYDEITALLNSNELQTLKNVNVVGLMGMATFTEDENQIQKEFQTLAHYFEQVRIKYPQFKTLSMGMSSDYKLAISAGSTIIRVGSAIFGGR
ncbi:MAG: YggS family pyridoxal phosphate-dependent enzyme [Flavobacteriaceae bacterium]|nr:YggS family pyridoxal phosphate-dependent enzyme [Flavobacteriaceae bacterium]